MYLTKWDKYLYQNYQYIKGGIFLGIIFVTAISVLFSLNRFFHMAGAILALISAFIYYSLEKRYKAILRSIDIRKKKALYRLCVEKLNVLELLVNRLDYLTQTDKMMILDSLWEELTCYCVTVRNYELLLKKINRNIYYFKERVNEFERKKSSQSQSYRHANSIVESFQVLGLPPDTNDFQLIKTRYRQLLKKYHPDINKSTSAVKMTQKINYAYEQLKTVFAH